MKRVKLAYGKTGLNTNFPSHADIIQPVNVEKMKDEHAAAMQALRNPIGTLPLSSMVRAEDKVAIVISDITRPTPNHKLVPWLLQELSHVPKEQFVIINGTGSHRANTQEELIEMLGVEVVENIRIVNNDAFDKGTHKYLGKSHTGASIYLNKEYCESDFKIVTGFIEPHYFAGFSGGPKGIMPGIAGIETILHFHSAAMTGHPNSRWAVLDGNPIQEEAVDIAMRCGPDFMFNVTLNNDKEITNFFAGDVLKAHRAGCEYVKQHAMAPCRQRYDIVVTTNSGYPLDMNLYQAGKGLSAAQQIVKEGGAIICAAECSDGLPDHGNFGKIMQMRDTPKQILEMIEQPDFSMFDQWAAQKQALILMWADIYLYSSLPSDTVKKMMMQPTHDIEQTIAALAAAKGGEVSIAVLPYGPITIPYVAQ